jgi:hypothetical protein
MLVVKKTALRMTGRLIVIHLSTIALELLAPQGHLPLLDHVPEIHHIFGSFPIIFESFFG